jgi:hypothetical protein
MQYAQLNKDGSFSHIIMSSGDISWDDNNFCSVAALIKDGKADQFRIVEISEVEPPIFDRNTQQVTRGGVELVSEKWQYTWIVNDLTSEEIAAGIIEKNRKAQAELVDKTQTRLDTFARTRNYESILSACTYSTSTVPKFAAEGQYCVDVRDATWLKLYEILAEVESGIRETFNSYADIENELPDLIWPDQI